MSGEESKKRVTLSCWSDVSTAAWAWQLQYGEHTKENTGILPDHDAKELSRACIRDALSSLKKPCVLEVFVYPMVLAGEKIPLADHQSENDVICFYTSDDKSPTMQHLASIAG